MSTAGYAVFTAVWFCLNYWYIRPVFERLNKWHVNHELLRCPGEAPQTNSSGLKVIIPGIGHTGRTSLRIALEQLGMRTYAFKDLAAYIPEVMRLGVAAEDLVGPIRRCKLDVLITEPLHDIFPTIVRASPGVKGILLLRDWDSWAKRAPAAKARDVYQNTQFRLWGYRAMCDWLPYMLAWPRGEPGASFYIPSVTNAMLDHCWSPEISHNDNVGERMGHELKFFGNETAYYEHFDWVRRVFPKSDLLEFDVKRHGWPELAAFLGQPAPPGASYPRVKLEGNSQVAVKMTLFPSKYAALYALLLASAALNWLVAQLAFRLTIGLLRPVLPRWLIRRAATEPVKRE